MSYVGTSSLDVKRINRGLVFRLIATENGITRPQIVQKSGLAKMTVSNIIQEFIDNGIVEATEDVNSTAVRKPLLFYPGKQAPLIVSVLIHQRSVAVSLCDCRLNILKSKQQQLPDDCNAEKLMHLLFELTDDIVQGQQIAGIGVATIGPVDTTNGIILSPLSFFGIHDLPVLALFRERYNAPVYMDHHCSCMALCEKIYGAGVPYKSFLLLSIASNLFGLGIVINDQLYSSLSGISCEIGHLSIDINGPVCACGNRGCLGSYLNFDSHGEAFRKSLDIIGASMAGLCHVMNPNALIISDNSQLFSSEDLLYLDKCINHRLQDSKRLPVLQSATKTDIELSCGAINVVNQLFNGEQSLY